MLGRVLAGAAFLVFAVAILATSIFRSASVTSYAFSLPPTPSPVGVEVLGENSVFVDYYLAHPGRVLPDNPLWVLKVARDRLWLLVTTNTQKKAELNLLFADKRLVSSKVLFERGKPELGLTTLVKAEKYLEEAVGLETAVREEGGDTSALLEKLAKAALKHQEVIIQEILQLAPSDAKPEIIKVQDTPRSVFENTKHSIQEKGLEAPQNPFEGGN